MVKPSFSPTPLLQLFPPIIYCRRFGDEDDYLFAGIYWLQSYDVVILLCAGLVLFLFRTCEPLASSSSSSSSSFLFYVLELVLW